MWAYYRVRSTATAWKQRVPKWNLIKFNCINWWVILFYLIRKMSNLIKFIDTLQKTEIVFIYCSWCNWNLISTQQSSCSRPWLPSCTISPGVAMLMSASSFQELSPSTPFIQKHIESSSSADCSVVYMKVSILLSWV